MKYLSSPVSRVHQLRPQTEFFQRFVADHHDDGGGGGWNDACRQSFGQPPAALLFDQLPERLDDRGPPLNLNQTDENKPVRASHPGSNRTRPFDQFVLFLEYGSLCYWFTVNQYIRETSGISLSAPTTVALPRQKRRGN